MWVVMRMYEDHVEKVWVTDDDSVHETALKVVQEFGESSFDDAAWVAESNSFDFDYPELHQGFHVYTLEDLQRYDGEYWVSDDEGNGVIVMKPEIIEGDTHVGP